MVNKSENQTINRRNAYGVGVAVKDDRIEIRGDLREEVKEILEEAGFQPVFAGG